MRATRRALTSAVICLLTVLVAAGLAELFLHLIHYPHKPPQFVEYDPVLGWRHKRNYTLQLATPEYRTTLFYDANGIRGLDPPSEKRPGVLRIVVVGDSSVDGYTVDVEDRLTEVLGTLLGPRFEVVNLGVTAYSTDQELLLLRQDGWKYHPDLVVLAFYHDDVWFNDQRRQSAREKPVFQLDASGKLTLTNVPIPYPKPEFADQFRLYGLARSAIKNSHWLYAAAHKAGLTQFGPPDRAPATPKTVSEDFIVYRRTPTPEVSNAWRTTLALMRQMQEETREHGAQFAVLYVPSRIELSPQEWTDSKIPADYDPGEVVRRFLEICDAGKMSCIEPSRRFREESSHRALFPVHDGHWNAAGHHLAGEILAEYVRQTWRLVPAGGP